MLNPATCLALWMVLVVLALNVASPLNAGVMAIVAVTAWMVSPMQFRRLLRRSRWLLLAVTLVFLLLTPDSRTLTVFGVSIPGGVGLQLACDQLGRLVFVMAMLALLLKHMGLSELVAALRQLSRGIGIPAAAADRAALRLTLTLQRLEQERPHDDFADWRRQFVVDAPTAGAPCEISFPVYQFGVIDRLILFVAFGGTIALLINSLIQSIVVNAS